MWRLFGSYWGWLGVVAMLASAVYRLWPQVVGLTSVPLSWVQWILLAVFVPFMAYSEGYRGFHLNFAPRVVARAVWLQGNASAMQLVLAPLVCMGYLHATPRRQATSLIVTTLIVLLVIGVRQLAQPWRGIIDAGVVLGLVLGVLSLLYHLAQHRLYGKVPAVALDLPLQ